MSLGSNIHDIEKVKEMDHHGSILLAPEIKVAPVNKVTMKFKDIKDHKASINHFESNNLL